MSTRPNPKGPGNFSSDRTIAQYASEIWNVTACPVNSARTTGTSA